MSIAVSASIQPSRLLKCLVTGMALGCIAIGLVVGLDHANNLSLSLRFFLMSACAVAGSLAILNFARRKDPVLLDGSANGLITLLVVNPGISAPNISSPVLRRSFELLNSSTLWSFMIILNLRAECGAKRTLLIFPDTVSPDVFRRLSVACRWIAGRGEKA